MGAFNLNGRGFGAQIVLCMMIAWTTGIGLATAGNTRPVDNFPYIIATMPIAGNVKQLVSLQRRPDILYALVTNHYQPNGNEKTGLYTFETSKAGTLRELNYLPITNGAQLDVDEAELQLLVLHAPKRSTFGIRLFDLQDPEAPVEIAKLDEKPFSQAMLSSDGKMLYAGYHSQQLRNQECPKSAFLIEEKSGHTILKEVTRPLTRILNLLFRCDRHITTLG